MVCKVVPRIILEGYPWLSNSVGNTGTVLLLASCRTLDILRLREGRGLLSGFLKGGQRDLGWTRQIRKVLVWDPLLDWPLLLGMLMGLSGIPLGMMLSVDSVQNLTQARAFSHLLRRQVLDSGSECASLVEQP